jgi:lysophospholipase L1-like esterase
MNTSTKILVVAAVVISGGILIAVILRARKNNVTCKSSYLFIGDSTTAHGNSFADQLKLLCGANVKKIAKSGAQTSWMLEQLSNELSTGKKYDVITILGGSNDIFSTLSIDSAKQNMIQMISMAQSVANHVVLVAPPSKAFLGTVTDQHRQLISQWEQFLKSFKGSQQGKRIHYIDLPQIVNNPQLFASDNQHINTQGHSVLLNEFADTLKIKTA